MVEFDDELDQIKVLLDHPMYCGYCQEEMRQIDKHMFKCAKCGFTYTESG